MTFKGAFQPQLFYDSVSAGVNDLFLRSVGGLWLELLFGASGPPPFEIPV